MIYCISPCLFSPRSSFLVSCSISFPIWRSCCVKQRHCCHASLSLVTSHIVPQAHPWTSCLQSKQPHHCSCLQCSQYDLKIEPTKFTKQQQRVKTRGRKEKKGAPQGKFHEITLTLTLEKQTNIVPSGILPMSIAPPYIVRPTLLLRARGIKQPGMLQKEKNISKRSMKENESPFSHFFSLSAPSFSFNHLFSFLSFCLSPVLSSLLSPHLTSSLPSPFITARECYNTICCISFMHQLNAVGYQVT